MKIDRVDDSVIERFFATEYEDRGMLKWGGFFLSDHTKALNEMFSETPEETLPQQSKKKIERTLWDSFAKQGKIHVQLNAMNVDSLVESFDGIIQDIQDNHILFKVEEELRELYPDEIRNVKWVGNTNYGHDSAFEKANREFENAQRLK